MSFLVTIGSVQVRCETARDVHDLLRLSKAPSHMTKRFENAKTIMHFIAVNGPSHESDIVHKTGLSKGQVQGALRTGESRKLFRQGQGRDSRWHIATK